MGQVKDDVREAAPAEATPAPTTLPTGAGLDMRGVSNAALARALRNGGGADLWRAAAGLPNSVRQRMVQRDPPTTTEVPEAPDVGKGGPHAWEYAFKHKVGDRASISFKLSFNPTEHKVAAEEKGKTEGGGAKASVGFWESKVARERSGGKAATKLTDSLLKAAASVETPIPGLVLEAQTKLFEVQVENAKTEAEINAIVVSFAIKGDVTEWMSDDAAVPEAERSKWKVIASGEAKVAPSLADLARIRDMWKARKEMKAAAEAIEVAAKRADLVQKELKAAESQIKTLEKELKQFQGYGKQQKKLYATKEAYQEAKALKQAALAEKRAAKVALEAEKKTLKQALKSQTAVLKKATGVMEKAASGLKSKAGRAMGKVLATQAGKWVAKALARALPIINILMVLWDIKDIAVFLYKVSQGAEVSFGMGGGDGGEGGAEGTGGESDAGGEGDAGTGGDGGTGDHDAGTGDQPDASGDTGDGGADTGTGTDGGPPAEPATKELNPNAKSVAEAMKGGTIKLDDDMRQHLDFAVPGDLTADQVAELVKRIQKRLGGAQQDPYEIIGMIQEEAERIRRGGEEKVETWVDGELQPDADQQDTVVDPSKGTTPAPATDDKQPAKIEAPKSLMPKLPPVLTWDEKASEFAWKPGGEEFLTGETYTIGDGLKVGINQAVLSNETQDKLVVATFSIEVMVDELPAGAAADYPWKVGDTRNYSLRFFRNVETGEVGEISEDAATTNAFEAALELKGGVFSLKRKGIVIEAPAASLRVDSIANQSKSGSGENVIYTVGVVVTPTALKETGAGMVDATGSVISFTVNTPVTVQLQFNAKK